MNRVLKAWRASWCRLGYHHSLNVIQSFGAGKHVGCPDCRREYGMHDGLRAFLPWDGEIEELYTDFGYDVPKYRAAWLAWIEAGRPKRHTPPPTTGAAPVEGGDA